jgi:hypothetical protein
MRRALAIIERSLGPDHPHVAIQLNNLATLLKDTDRPTEAEPLFGPNSVARQRSAVVFPAPFGPRRAYTSPGATWKVSPSTAVRGP